MTLENMDIHYGFEWVDAAIVYLRAQGVKVSISIENMDALAIILVLYKLSIVEI